MSILWCGFCAMLTSVASYRFKPSHEETAIQISKFTQTTLRESCYSPDHVCVVVDLGCSAVLASNVRTSAYVSFIDYTNIDGLRKRNFDYDLLGSYQRAHSDVPHMVLLCDQCLGP